MTTPDTVGGLPELKRLANEHLRQLERLARRDSPGRYWGTFGSKTPAGKVDAYEVRNGRTVRMRWECDRYRSSRKEIIDYYVKKLSEPDNAWRIEDAKRQVAWLAGI